ncbi:hypothetical protein HYW43_03755 [Candidatus Daviesbacteria bacterium]|nr:hypothetical protein [Candidatus Daviesbacteria bacterium]
MALNVTELRNGTFYKEGNNILLVLTYEHVKTGRGSGNIKVKVRNLRTGSVVEKSFITGARVDEASVEKKKAQFLYRDGLIYVIAETGPGEKGNTVSNVFKEAVLDNGLVVKVPMFMKVGEKVKVDTRSGEYVERVK